MKEARYRIWGVKDGQRVYIDQKGRELTMQPEISQIREAEDVLEAAKDYLDVVIDAWRGDWRTDSQIRKWAKAWDGHSASDPMPKLMTPDEMRQMYRNTINLTSMDGDDPEDRDFLDMIKPSVDDVKRYEAKINMSDDALAALAKDSYDKEMKRREPHTDEYMRGVEEDSFISNNQGPPWRWETIEECIAIQKGQAPREHMGPRGAKPKDFPLCRECLKPSRWVWHACFPGGHCGSAGWVAICEECKTWHKERTCIIS